MLITEFKFCQSWEPEAGQFAFKDLFLHLLGTKYSCAFLNPTDVLRNYIIGGLKPLCGSLFESQILMSLA